ncbi:MAG: mismatch repair protein MutL [Blastocatellia bacterium]|jgi:DNA mismatch repair protein MutL|nr:mismatch repair protein MutL [Blastocatellia bacterium]
MTKIRVLSDQLANLIAAGEVVERPASVCKELVENAIDAGAHRIAIDVEAGGRRLLKITDDGEGMNRDDAILAFERHATSKLSSAEDLNAIGTLGFRGEALASIASVARVELITSTEPAPAATRVIIEGGRMRDVKDAAHPRGTTIAVRDLFFNVPARRKFLRSEATESFHLTNLVTHYALAHPEISFTLTSNGRETLRATPAKDLHERAYQVFGQQFIDSLLEVGAQQPEDISQSPPMTRVTGYVSAPRERRTSRDAQYLFVNGRFVRDRLIGRALSEGYRSILPHGVYPAALLFIEVPLEEVDVNVHPAKTEVRFRRAAVVADAVRDAVRSALASAGFAPAREPLSAEAGSFASPASDPITPEDTQVTSLSAAAGQHANSPSSPSIPLVTSVAPDISPFASPDVIERAVAARQEEMDFAGMPIQGEEGVVEPFEPPVEKSATARDLDAILRDVHAQADADDDSSDSANAGADDAGQAIAAGIQKPSAGLPPLASASKFMKEAVLGSVSANIRPIGQLDESFIVATDGDGLLLIDQHVAHERILFDKYRALVGERIAESQNLLIPETFDLTPAQAAAFDAVAPGLESYGFDLMRLSGRTVAIKATPADLPASEARNMLSEVLDAVDAEKKGAARETMRDEIAASLACHAAIKINTPLAPEKMRWLIDRLLLTSSPTTCPHGRPVILRLANQDILKGFHRI